MSFHPEYARSADEVASASAGRARVHAAVHRARSRRGPAPSVVLHAAFDQRCHPPRYGGCILLDDFRVGHNERLIARALQTWSGERSRIVVATKGGLTRPQGRLVPDGWAVICAPHAKRACVRSA